MSIDGWQLLQPALARGARFTRACIRIDDSFGEIDINELQAWLERMTFFPDHRADDWSGDSEPRDRTFAFVVWDDEGRMWSSGSDNGVAVLRETPTSPAAWLRAMRSNPLGLKEIGGGTDRRENVDLAAEIESDDPAQLRVKLDLAHRIALALDDREADVRAGAAMIGADDDAVRDALEAIVGLNSEDIERIRNGIVKNVSVWQLMRVLSALGHDIATDVVGADGGTGEIYVVSDAPELADLGPGDSEIPPEHRWNSDDENVTDEQRGAADDALELAEKILSDIKSWQLSLPSSNPALDIRIESLPPVVVKRLREIADTHIAVALSFTDDTEKP